MGIFRTFSAQFDTVFFKLFNKIDKKDFRLEVAGNENLETRRKIYDEKLTDLNLILVASKKFIDPEKQIKHKAKIRQIIMSSYETYNKILSDDAIIQTITTDQLCGVVQVACFGISDRSA